MEWTPRWLPGETLYGWCGRFHRLLGAPLASETCRRLFGSPRVGLSHDIPGSVQEFAMRMGIGAAAAPAILLERTLVGYYLRFRTCDERHAVVNRLLVGGPRSLKTELGCLASGFRANHPLRACPKCVEQDRRDLGLSTWRLVHQLPAVLVCSEHLEPLWTAKAKSDGRLRFQWLLPDDVPASERSSAPRGSQDDPGWLAQVALATDSCDLMKATPDQTPDRASEARLFRLRLVELGMAGDSGRIQAGRVGDALHVHLRQFVVASELASLAQSPAAAMATLRRLLNPKGPPLHPLRHLVLARWLFGSWRTFWERHQSAVGPAPITAPTKADAVSDADRDNESLRRRVADLVDQGAAPTAAAREVGVAVNTAIQWVTLMGAEVKRRPKVAKPAVREGIERGLRAGLGKAQIAADAGVSVETVTRILLASPKLRLQRQVKLHAQHRSESRKALQQFTARHPEAGISAARAACPSAYAWESRHDSEWFEAWRRNLPKAERTVRPRVDWDARDRDFSLQVVNAALPGGANDYRQLSVGDLVRSVPGLQPKLRKLDRLPLTRAALAAAVEAMAARRGQGQKT